MFVTRRNQECGKRFTTVEQRQLMVAILSRSVATRAVDVDRKACKGRPLRELDEVAYLRFARVYRAFGSAEDFEREIQMLRTEREVQDRPARQAAGK